LAASGSLYRVIAATSPYTNHRFAPTLHVAPYEGGYSGSPEEKTVSEFSSRKAVPFMDSRAAPAAEVSFAPDAGRAAMRKINSGVR